MNCVKNDIYDEVCLEYIMEEPSAAAAAHPLPASSAISGREVCKNVSTHMQPDSKRMRAVTDSADPHRQQVTAASALTPLPSAKKIVLKFLKRWNNVEFTRKLQKKAMKLALRNTEFVNNIRDMIVKDGEGDVTEDDEVCLEYIMEEPDSV